MAILADGFGEIELKDLDIDTIASDNPQDTQGKEGTGGGRLKPPPKSSGTDSEDPRTTQGKEGTGGGRLKPPPKSSGTDSEDPRTTQGKEGTGGGRLKPPPRGSRKDPEDPRTTQWGGGNPRAANGGNSSATTSDDDDDDTSDDDDDDTNNDDNDDTNVIRQVYTLDDGYEHEIAGTPPSKDGGDKQPSSTQGPKDHDYDDTNDDTNDNVNDTPSPDSTPKTKSTDEKEGKQTTEQQKDYPLYHDNLKDWFRDNLETLVDFVLVDLIAIKRFERAAELLKTMGLPAGRLLDLGLTTLSRGSSAFLLDLPAIWPLLFIEEFEVTKDDGNEDDGHKQDEDDQN